MSSDAATSVQPAYTKDHKNGDFTLNMSIPSSAQILGGNCPSSIHKPAFLMCAPFSHSTEVANNAWMEEEDAAARAVDKSKGLIQFLNLYHHIAADSLIYLVPAPANCGLQDAVFTANLAFIPEHLPAKDTALLANFTSEPRKGETALALPFFQALGYQTKVVPYRFEGEAEIKHLYDNVYIGGYGLRSERKAYEWMEQHYDMKIVMVEEVDPYLYHLDCSIFPLTRDETIVCTKLFLQEEIAQIEKVTGIIDVAADAAFNGICNSLRLHNMILNASNIHELRAGTEDYALEIAKNRALEDIAAARGFEVCYFNLSEYLKSGALLSCMLMHLNRCSYSMQLT